MGLQFGRKYSEAPAATGGGGGKWIKSLKEGETKVRFLQEIKDWVVYYEHYNPAGTAFPCTGDRSTCPGCTSTNERMKQASRKNAVNALVGEYVDVYKLPVKLTNRLVIRSERNGGTITDRDYLITRVGKDQSTEYDLEALSPRPVDLSKHQLADIESMLAESFRENFPDFDPDRTGDAGNQERPTGAVSSVAPAKPATEAYLGTGPTAENPWTEGTGEPPFDQASASLTEAEAQEEVEISEEALRGMQREPLLALCHNEQIELPTPLANNGSVNEIVDYLLENI